MDLTPAPLVKIADDAPPEGAKAYFWEHFGRKIRFLLAPSVGKTRGSVLISPGRSEFIEKYFEVARECQARGFAVLITDHYGQGLSGRALKDRWKGHIASFDVYADDLEAMIEAAGDRLPGPHVLLGHSMGGMVALKIVARGRLDVAAAALSAPMLGIHGLAAWASLVASGAALLGLARRSVPGRGEKTGPPAYHGNMLTHDSARFDRMVSYYEAEHGLMLGAPTFGWVAAAARAIRQMRRPEAAKAVKIPVLIASAEDDSLVSNHAEEHLAARSTAIQVVDMPDARHEILMEKDPVRACFWTAFDALLERAGV